uniref:Uncharacterized protein n=1 Tax=Lactuca sativa TaxID=4236 RepID=A0A9R1V187_LACSA|nr:hypothetical protein LSAT_V11C700376670 [Lactuca sativa]
MIESNTLLKLSVPNNINKFNIDTSLTLPLQALKQLHRLDAGNLDSHRCLIRFFHKMASRLAPVTGGEKLISGVLEAERPTIRVLFNALAVFALREINLSKVSYFFTLLFNIFLIE